MHWYRHRHRHRHRHRQIILGSGERFKIRTFDCFELEDISHFNRCTHAFRKITFIVGLKHIIKSAMVASRYWNERRDAALKLTGSTAAWIHCQLFLLLPHTWEFALLCKGFVVLLIPVHILIDVAKLVSPLQTKRRLLYLKTQFVPRSKHFSPRL